MYCCGRGSLSYQNKIIISFIAGHDDGDDDYDDDDDSDDDDDG